MQDLNDLYYFVQVVDHGGFAPAGRVTNIPKSKLSRRIALLEERLGVRLIQRSTRHFSITEIGQSYYQHCKAMLVEAEAAQDTVDAVRAEPRGLVKLSCPIALLHTHVGDMLARFMMKCPHVTIALDATNRRVDVVSEGMDLAIRVRPPPLQDSDLVLKVLANRGQCLVASPALVAALPSVVSPVDLAAWPSLGLGSGRGDYSWDLQGPDGMQSTIVHAPRFVTTDMTALRTAAVAGVGVVQLPLLMVKEHLHRGELVRLLAHWAPKPEMIHAVYPSRRGQLPSVRALLEHLSEEFNALIED
ncbi:MAG: LysR family transcriptional regulator [Limnohabitans sp.]